MPTCLKGAAQAGPGVRAAGVPACVPGEIGDLHFPASVFDSYTGSLLRNVDTTGITESGLKVVVDASNGSAGLVLPSLLGKLGVDSLTINPGLDESRPTETADTRRAGLVRLGEIVASARAAFGVRFDPVGERLSLVDEKDGSSRTTGPCSSCSTWWPRSGAVGGWRCR